MKTVVLKALIIWKAKLSKEVNISISDLGRGKLREGECDFLEEQISTKNNLLENIEKEIDKEEKRINGFKKEKQ